MQLFEILKHSVILGFAFISNILAVTTNVATPTFSVSEQRWRNEQNPERPLSFEAENQASYHFCNCIEGAACPEFVDVLERRIASSDELRHLTCGFNGLIPLVCCNQVVIFRTSRTYPQLPETYNRYDRNCRPSSSITTVQPRIDPSTTPYHNAMNHFTSDNFDQRPSDRTYSHTTRNINVESSHANNNGFSGYANDHNHDHDFAYVYTYETPMTNTYNSRNSETSMASRSLPSNLFKTNMLPNIRKSIATDHISQIPSASFSNVNQPNYVPHKNIYQNYWSRENDNQDTSNTSPQNNNPPGVYNSYNRQHDNYHQRHHLHYNHNSNDYSHNRNYQHYYPHKIHFNNPSHGYSPGRDYFSPSDTSPNYFHNHYPHTYSETFPTKSTWISHTNPYLYPTVRPFLPNKPTPQNEKTHPTTSNTTPNNDIQINYADHENETGNFNETTNMDVPLSENSTDSSRIDDATVRNIEKTDWKKELLPIEDCGVVSIGERIVGGKSASLGAYPWVARIGYTRSGSDKILYRCGGTLISTRYIVTAAHCVTNLPGGLQLATVRLGELDERTDPDCYQSECADPVQDITPEIVKIHEEYDTPKFRNDIALIRLQRPVNFSAYINPICLPFGYLRDKSYTGLKFQVAGWGATDLGVISSSPILQWVTVTLLPKGDCAKVFAERTTTNLGPGQICAGGERGRDSCEGDSGGPLMRIEQLDPDEIQRYFLVGLVSFGARHCGSENLPGVYTDIPKYLDWILENIEV